MPWILNFDLAFYHSDFTVGDLAFYHWSFFCSWPGMVCGWTCGETELDLEQQRWGLDSMAFKLICLIVGDGGYEGSNSVVGGDDLWV